MHPLEGVPDVNQRTNPGFAYDCVTNKFALPIHVIKDNAYTLNEKEKSHIVWEITF
jgi:hypothetical protein